MTLALPFRQHRFGDLGRVPAIDYYSAEGLEEKSAVRAAQKGLGYERTISPRNTWVELLLHPMSAPKTFAVQLVEEVIDSLCWSKFVRVTFNEFQVKLGVEFLEDAHA